VIDLKMHGENMKLTVILVQYLSLKIKEQGSLHIY